MSKRDKAKRFTKRLLTISLIVIVLFAGWLAYFFLSNDAPLLHGEVQYHIPFNSNQKLDVYYPTEDVYDNIPVVVFIHGGAWIGGDKVSVNNNRFNEAFNSLRDAGYAIVSSDYTLARNGESPFPQNIVDSFDAMDWVQQNAEAYHFDLNNVTIFGESAGSHLGMMVAFAEPSDFGLNHKKLHPTCVVDVYGPSNLNTLYHRQAIDSLKTMIAQLPGRLKDQLNLPVLLFGFDPDEDPDRAQEVMNAFSPVTYLEANHGPVLMIHGNKDIVVPIEQSEELKYLFDSLGIGNEFHVLPGVDHAFRGATSSQKDSVQSWITDFILANYQDLN
ncbi:MAG: alpha/beta hydrolase [Cytophagales bacterium]|nr:alpha/beta hydrolase [Cytophagales bacterium]